MLRQKLLARNSSYETYRLPNGKERGEVPIFNVAGRFAYTLWQSVYLGKQASARNRALIIFDWFKSELFGRDITRL